MIATLLLCFVLLLPWFVEARLDHSGTGDVSEQEVLRNALESATRGDFVFAINDLSSYLNLSPNSIEGNQLLGSLIVKTGGDLSKALQHFEIAMRSGGSDRLHIVVNYLETLRITGHLREAINLGRDQVVLHGKGILMPSKELVAVYISLATSELMAMEHEEAVIHLWAALRMDNLSYAAYKQLILTYQRIEQFELAEKTCVQALKTLGEDYYLNYLLATSLHYQKRIDEALSLYLRVLRLQPTFHDVLGNIATAYQGLGQTKEAYAYYLRAIEHNPEDASLCNNLGALLGSMGRKEEEVQWLNEALRLNPYMVQALMNLASYYQGQGQLEIARSYVNRTIHVIVHRPEYAKTGIVRVPMLRLRMLTMLSPVVSSWNEMLAQRLELYIALQELIAEYTLYPLPEQPQLDDSLEQLHFYISFAGINDLPVQRLIAHAYRLIIRNVNVVHAALQNGNRQTSLQQQYTLDLPPEHGRRRRVGFISKFLGIFEPHGLLLEGILMHLPRESYTIICLPVARPDGKPLSPLFSIICNEVVEISLVYEYSLHQINSLDLDVLVFADSLGEPVNHFLLHNRLAPLQMVFWGNPTTTGSDNVDYFVSSDVMEDPWTTRRPAHEAMYSEQIVRLGGQGIFYYPPLPPHIILEQVNMLHLIKGVELYTRTQFGIPDEAFVYMLPQSLFKLHPLFDLVIVQLLLATPKETHFLCTGGRQRSWTETFKARLLSRFEAVNQAEIFRTRVHFAERVSSENFVNLLQLADVILHPFPFDGSRTSADSIIADKPYVTLPTMYLRGRMGYSFYRSMNLPDLVAADVPDYLRILLRLHSDRDFYDNATSRIKERKSLIWHDMETVYEWTRFFQAVTLESNHFKRFDEFLTASFQQQQDLLRQNYQHRDILQHYNNWTVSLELERTRDRKRNMKDFDLQYSKRLHNQLEVNAIESEEVFLHQLAGADNQSLAYLSKIVRQDTNCTPCQDGLPWPQLFKHWQLFCAELKFKHEESRYTKYCQVITIFTDVLAPQSLQTTGTISDIVKTDATKNTSSRTASDLFQTFHNAIRRADYSKALQVSSFLRSFLSPSDLFYSYTWKRQGDSLVLVTSSYPMLLLETGLTYLQLGQYSLAHEFCAMASNDVAKPAHPVLSFVCINLAGLYMDGDMMDATLKAGMMAYQQLVALNNKAEENNVTVMSLLPYSPFSVPSINNLELNILAAYKRFGHWQSCLDVASSIFNFFTHLPPSSRPSSDNQIYLSAYFVLLSFVDWHPSHRVVLDHVQSLMKKTNVWPYKNVTIDTLIGVSEESQQRNLSRQITLYDIVLHVQARGDHLLNMLISCLHSAEDSRMSKLLNDISFDIMIMIRLIDEKAKRRGVKSITSGQSLGFHKSNLLVLVSQYYISNSTSRQRLNDMVLRKNMRNPSISQIFLLTESLVDLSFFHDFEGNEKLVQVVIGERLTFRLAFQFANSRLVGRTVIVSNADIYFDHSLSLLLEHPFPNKIALALLKWIDHSSNEFLPVSDISESHISLQLRTDSQDSWIFKSPLPELLLSEDTAFPLGVPRCDNRIALLFEKAGMQVFNPALFVHGIEIQPRDLYAGGRDQANLYSHERSVNLPGRNVYLLDSLHRIQTPQEEIVLSG